MQSRLLHRGMLTPRVLMRRPRRWRQRLCSLRPLPSALLRAIGRVQAVPLRFGRRDRTPARPRLVLRALRQRVIVRRPIFPVTTREVVRAISLPPGAGSKVARKRNTHSITTRVGGLARAAAPASRRRSPRLTMRTVVRDARRVERVHVRTVRERLQVEHCRERLHTDAGGDQRPIVARAKVAVRSGSPTEAAPTSLQTQPAASANPPSPSLGGERDLSGPRRAAPQRPPSVDEIAERVLRIIERRARAQRERLGSV